MHCQCSEHVSYNPTLKKQSHEKVPYHKGPRVVRSETHTQNLKHFPPS